MKKHIHGSSLYYATDKNVFDALNINKVTIPTIVELFKRRNVLVSKKTPRDQLALYFSKITHDYYDHQSIAARLGITSRRERITSMDVKGIEELETVDIAIEKIKQSLESIGDIVLIRREGENIAIDIHYSEVDYKKSEFSQVQKKNASIEFLKASDGYVVRSTQADYINNIRETLIKEIEQGQEAPIEKMSISLEDIKSPKLRSKFFNDLAGNLPHYVRRDVTDVYVYKVKPPSEHEDDDEDETLGSGTHVERVFLRGNGVTRSEIFHELLEQENYYIIKMGWTATETLGHGNVYEIEVNFSDPINCSGFSFMVTGVFPVESSIVSDKKRSPSKSEISAISNAIESKSRSIVRALREDLHGST